MDKEIERALSKAKIDIIETGTHFLSAITFSMVHVMTKDIATACVDGKTVSYNPHFFMILEPTGRTFVMAHESWHVALNHIGRAVALSDEDRKIYFQAADYVINLILVNSGFLMPKVTEKMIQYAPPGSDIKLGDTVGLLDSRFEGMSTDEVFKILKEEAPPPQTMLDDDVCLMGTSEEQVEVEEEIKQIIVRAITRSKLAEGENPGDIPNEVQRTINKLLNPKLPWETLLRRFLTNTAKDNYTWKKPNRRFFPEFILPSQFSSSLGHLVFVLDTSCSLSDKQSTAALSEMRYVHRTFKPAKLTIMTCDRIIHDIYEIGPNERIEDLKFNGGGGTSFHPVFEHFKKKPPQALIYFTDLRARQITEKPKYPVMWICNSNHKPALIGKTIYLKD